MKIRVAKSAGFCFGVRRAIELALATASRRPSVTMLGDIVHNEDVIASIAGAGVKKIKALGDGRGKTLLVRAHGIPRRVAIKARQHGYRIVDATCPMVKEIHKLAVAAERRGYPVIIVGDKKHDEVRGIVGQLKKKALIIDDIRRIPWAAVKKLSRAAVVVQSTQHQERTEEIVRKLKERVSDLCFYNTICGPTRVKQAEIKRLPLENDAVVIIGSKGSANTRRLYEISKRLNPRSYWIGSKDELRPAWFKGIKTVGITAGASTPQETTREVVDFLKKL